MKSSNELSYYLKAIKNARQQGDNLKAKRHSELALKLLNSLVRSPKDEYELYYQIAYTYSNLAEYSQAIDISYKAYLLGLKHRFHPASMANIYLMIASNLIMTKNIDQALSQLGKVHEYFNLYGYETPPMTKGRHISSLIHMAYCYLYKRELVKAGEIIEGKLASYQALMEAEYGLSHLDYHHLRGEYLMEKKDYAGAKDEFEECIRISDNEKFPIGRLESQIHLAIIYLLHKQVDGAKELLRIIYYDANKLKSNSLRCESALLLSKCYSLNDELDKSLVMDKQIKALLNKLDNNWLYEKIGEFDRLFQQLQKLYALRESPKYVPEILTNIMDKRCATNSDKHIIVGSSLVMKEIYHVIDKIAPTELPILVQGETGTGKELICRFIHQKSNRSEKPYLAINCGAMPENLLENELFGHTKGAFTGALDDKKGYIELASGGTLMLDEVANMSLVMQQKLLRVLEGQEVWPLGAEKPVSVNTRFIFVSNQNVEQMLAKGTLRNDLFFRINAIIVNLPPLRERREDIPMLVEHFLNKYVSFSVLARENGDSGVEISQPAVEILTDYLWPGNVRELENEIQRICILHRDEKTITEKMISEHISDRDSEHRSDRDSERIKAFKQTENSRPYLSPGGKSLKILLREYERNIIMETINKYDGNITRASRHLGYDRSGLYRKMRQLRISSVKI